MRYDPKLEDHVTAGRQQEPRYFRSPALRRITAEQFLDSLRVIVSGKLVPAERAFLDARSTAIARALGRPASRNEISTAVPTTWPSCNRWNCSTATSCTKSSMPAPVFADSGKKQDERRLVDRLYRAALSRPATTAEKNLGRAYLQSAESTDEGLQDMLWAIVSGPEFQYVK